MCDNAEQWVPEIFEASEPQVRDHLIETERLVMRPVEISHTDAYAEMVGDTDVMRYVGLIAGQIMDRAHAESLVAGAADAWHKRGYGRWSVFERASDSFVGFSGFRCEQGTPELICLLNKQFWGRGYATESCAAALEYGFSSLGFTEVCAYCRPNNDKARRLMERLGGEFIGITDFHGVDGAAYRFVPRSL